MGRHAEKPAAGTGLSPHPLALAGLLLLAVVLAFLPLRHSGYVQDDELAVERNRIVERGDLAEIFGTSYWEGARGADRSLYRPVVILSYALERRLTTEANPLVSQVVNVGIHLLTTAALGGLLRRVGGGRIAAWTAAALFAVHPVHVEAVANIVGRAEMLAALFTLLALGLLSASGPWGDRAPRHPRAAAWAAGLALFLALGSKEVAFAAPALMVALELLFRPAPNGRDRAWWIDRATALAPSILAGVLYLILRVATLETVLSVQQAHPMDNPLVELSEPARTATALGLVVRYAWLLFYPIRLAADYSGGVIAVESGLLAPRALFGLVLILALAFVVVRAAVRRWRMPVGESADDDDRGLSRVAFGILLMGLPYLVIGNLLFPVGAIFAERFLYLPSAGFCWLMGLLVREVHGIELRIGPLRRGRAVVPVILLLLLTSFVLRTWARSNDWRDNWTVFRSASRVNPASPRAHFILGRLTLERGDPEAAIAYFDRTIELYPEHTTAWMEKGNALAALGRYEEAEAMYRETLARSPNYAKAHLNLALALRRQGRTAEAERELSKAALGDPRSATTWAELGNLMLQLQRWDEAADAYRRAIALGRTDLARRLALAESGAANRRR